MNKILASLIGAAFLMTGVAFAAASRDAEPPVKATVKPTLPKRYHNVTRLYHNFGRAKTANKPKAKTTAKSRNPATAKGSPQPH